MMKSDQEKEEKIEINRNQKHNRYYYSINNWVFS